MLEYTYIHSFFCFALSLPKFVAFALNFIDKKNKLREPNKFIMMNGTYNFGLLTVQVSKLYLFIHSQR